MIGVTLLTNFGEASNPVWAFPPGICGGVEIAERVNNDPSNFQPGRRMTKRNIVGGMIVAAQLMGAFAAFAGPWEDGMAAYNRGDYMPAIRLFRPLAEQGNAKAQNILGVMFRRGEGVPRNAARAHMWFSFAAKRGEAGARAELREVSRTMTREEISQAEAMARACEASNYRQCEY
jgi:hypothetical protein